MNSWKRKGHLREADHQEVCKSMPSQEITMSAGGIEKGVEQQSTTITEWSAEIDMAEEAGMVWHGHHHRSI